ncbi:MAG: iron export ABC transporter permease subunit FetB, partial [Eubacterium callanderi]
MNNSTVMDLSIFNLAIAYTFVLLLLVIFKARGIKREK